MTSQKPLIDGNQYQVNLRQSINLDNINENVYAFDDGAAPHLTNTGILHDDGVTNLYQTSTTDSYDKVLFAPNGKKLQLQYSSQGAYIDGNRVATIGPYGLSSRVSLPFGAIDAAKTSTGTTLLLTKGSTIALNAGTFSTSAAAGGNQLRAVYGNGVWVSIASSLTTGTSVQRSTDNGVTFAVVAGVTAPGGGAVWKDIGYGNGVFVIISGATTTTTSIARSTNGGLTWSFATLASAPTSLARVKYGNGVWIATDTASLWRSTDDGATWTKTTLTLVNTTIPATDGAGNWLVAGDFSAYGYSTDNGANWTTAVTSSPSLSLFTDVEYGNGYFMAVTTGSVSAGQMKVARTTSVATSLAYISGSTFLTSTNAKAIAYGNGVWQAVDASTSVGGSVYRSTDNGTTWSAVTVAAHSAWASTSYGNTSFIATASSSAANSGFDLFINTSVLSYTVSEYNGTTVTQSKTLTTSVSALPNYACLVKSHQMTYANVQVAYQYFSGTTVTAAVFVSGTSNTIFSGAGLPNLFQAISAYSNGGTTIVAGVATNTTTGNTAYYNTTPSNYAAWTNVTEVAFLANYEEFNTAASLTLNLVGTGSAIATANQSNWSKKISISTAGAVTVTASTEAGLVVIPTDTYAGFGFRSGRYKSTAATKYSPFIVDGGTTPPPKIQETTTDYGSASAGASFGPQAAGAFGLTSGQRAFVYTIAGKPAVIAWGGVNGAMPISEYGNVSPTRPVDQWTDGTTYWVMWQSFASSPGPVVLATINANDYTIKPISKDVVQLTDSYGTIINTTTGYSEPNQGAHCPAFMSDIYLAGTAQLAYQTNAIYSNAVDVGSGNSLAGITTMTVTTIAGAVQYPMIMYQGGTSGILNAKALFSGGALIATDTTVAYTVNSNLPPPVDATYQSGGIRLLGQSALQTVNEADADGFAYYYAGYLLANQYPTQYNFFNLFGQLYGFDGTKVFRLPINGATAGTPEQVAFATGLTFIANSPVVAWFLSSYDNAIYTFSGGQKVEKWQEMTGIAAVQSGTYEVLENALYLQLADNTVMIFRDGDLASQLTNAFTSQTIYGTDLGTYFVNNTTPSQSALWTYQAGSGTPIPLTWQSGFHGLGRNQYVRVTKIVLTLKVADPTTTDIVVNYKQVDSGTVTSETATYAGGTYQSSSTGYVRIQYNPTQPVGYGASIGIQVSKKCILYNVVMYYTDGGMALIANNLP